MQIMGFEPRLYQQTILHSCVRNNCLIVLPTGLGKTKTAILVAVHRLNSFPNSKVLFLTPTKPLANQICQEFKKCTDIGDSEIFLFTGAVSPEKREGQWNNAKIVVSTPQGCVNDVINGRMSLEDISLLVFDEAHRAVGDYDYVFLAKQYHKKGKFPRILGLTASPGSDLETITEVSKNLFIEEIELRTEDDPDVKPYVQELDIDYVLVNLPENFKDIKKFLDDCLKSKLQKIKDLGFIASVGYTTKKDILTVQKELQRKVMTGEKDFSLWAALSLVSEAIKVHHTLELFETQGICSTFKYVNDLYSSAEKTKVKAVKSLVKDLNFKSAYIKISELYEKNIEHPKLGELKKKVEEELNKNVNSKIIVFNQYRESASRIVEELNKINNVRCSLFVGQMKKGGTGISQKEQIKMLEDFTNGVYNVLVSTSIGEEGLDIPKVDVVIFYEPVPSAIRTIQRTGRTARTEKGKVIVLVTKNTRDEAYRWSAHHKEKRMHQIITKLRDNIRMSTEVKQQPTLDKFVDEKKIKIFADFREKGSGIIKELANQGVDVKMQNLAVGDYILSNRVCVEFKTKMDFVSSLIDKRLLQQVKALKDNFEKPLIIIEGDEDLYSVRKVHPNAINGMLAAIAIDFGIPIIFTKNFLETVSLLKAIANREQEFEKKDIGVRGERKPLTTREQQEFIIESFPNVGPNMAKSLLKEFKSVKNIVNAEGKDLQKVENLGPKKAEDIKRIVEDVYEPD
ncbi:MAG: DEAD/DEAH box helicase [Nanoarchaeota archaeon]|nr:DEAD/DEAH box helicase [Nanoarchaeota archaeon]